MTLYPSARSMAATVEESTPPDMATAMVLALSTQDLENSTRQLVCYQNDEPPSAPAALCTVPTDSPRAPGPRQRILPAVSGLGRRTRSPFRSPHQLYRLPYPACRPAQEL